ncbi:hypothetical protein RFI_26137, partial [Reticulomyxa filosa]
NLGRKWKKIKERKKKKKKELVEDMENILEMIDANNIVEIIECMATYSKVSLIEVSWSTWPESIPICNRYVNPNADTYTNATPIPTPNAKDECIKHNAQLKGELENGVGNAETHIVHTPTQQQTTKNKIKKWVEVITQR